MAQQYVEFFVPAKTQPPVQAVGAVILGMAAPMRKVTQVSSVADHLAKFKPPSPVSSVASKIVDLGPVGIIGVTAVAALAGYVIVKKVWK